MAKRLRVLVILLLAVFAAGTVAQAMSIAAMDAKMALTAVDDADKSGCQGCPGGNGDMPPCDTGCVSPALAVVPAAEAALPEAGPTAAGIVTDGLAGAAGPPEPSPPRSIS